MIEDSLAGVAGAPSGHSQRSVTRGHGAKIAEAIDALRDQGRLPPNLRPVERDRRILGWLGINGYAGDLPSRFAIARFYESHMQSAPDAQ